MRLWLFARRTEIPRALWLALLFPVLALIALIAVFARPTLITLIARPTPSRLLARAIMQSPQGAAQRFDLAFVRELLAFGQFHQFQNFLHLIHGALERFHDLHHLINRLMNGGRAMLGFGTSHGNALGQTLHAFEQRPGLCRRTSLSRRTRTLRTHGQIRARGAIRTLNPFRSLRAFGTRRNRGLFRGARSFSMFHRRSRRGFGHWCNTSSFTRWWQFSGTRAGWLAPTATTPPTPPPMITTTGRGFPTGRCRTAWR